MIACKIYCNILNNLHDKLLSIINTHDYKHYCLALLLPEKDFSSFLRALLNLI